MNTLDSVLTDRLEAIRVAGLHRRLRRINSPQGETVEIDGRTCTNFSSNDYLGLANHAALKEAAIKSVESFGTGSGASRLICGSLAPHHELEDTLAQFKHCERALTFSSGYAAALGTIMALLGRDDIIVIDKLVHACIVDAARVSGAKIRVFNHNDMNSLSEILKWTDKRIKAGESKQTPCVLIVTESVFSMDGDQAPLAEIVQLKDHHGAWLMVDEAHATGLFGEHRSGLVEKLGLSAKVEIQMGTLGKAVGSSGGFIAGSGVLIEFLVNRSRSFIFSTAPPPASSAAAMAGIRLIQSEEGAKRNEHLWSLVNHAFNSISKQPCSHTKPTSAIIPFLIGGESDAVAVFEKLMEAGYFIPAVRYPTVAKGKARLRFTLTASHSINELDEALDLLKRAIPISSNLMALQPNES